MRDIASGQRGAVTAAMLIACVILAVAGFGTWGFLRNWRFLAETQLRLDRCTQAAALDLKETQKVIESTNRQIQITRALLLAGTLEPTVAASLRAVIQGLALRQEAALGLWRTRQLAWLLPRHCGSGLDRRAPLPTLEWVRPPQDPFGPLPLIWEDMPEEFDIRASHFPRRSVARVSRIEIKTEDASNEDGENEGGIELPHNRVSAPLPHQWRARWVSPL